MADVRSQRKFLASEVKRVAKRVAEAEARLNMECDRSREYGEVGAQKSLGSEISAAPSYCSPSWLLTFGILLLAEDQKAIRCDKKSLIKGSGSLWQRLQETCFVSKCLHSTGCCKLIFWTVQTLPEHHFIHIQFHTKSRYSTTHKAQSPTEHIKSDWMIWRRQNEEHIWIFLGSELHSPSISHSDHNTPYFITPLLGAASWWPGDKMKARGFSMAGQSSSVNVGNAPLPIFSSKFWLRPRVWVPALHSTRPCPTQIPRTKAYE